MKVVCAMLTVGAVLAGMLPASAELVTGIEAVVDNSLVTHDEVEMMTEPAATQLFRQYRNDPDVLQKKLSDARTESLDQLLSRQLILRDFKTTYAANEAMIEKEVKKEIDKEIEDEIRTSYGGSRVAMIQTLAARGITFEKHRQQIHDRIIISFLRQKNITSGVIVSPHKVEAYYQDHKEQYKVEDEVKLRMIVLKNPNAEDTARVEKRAEEIASQLKDGATFAEMATIYSEGSQRNQGGDWGWWEVSKLSKGLSDMAASLQAGQRSGVTSRSPGDDYWICQYENGKPAAGRHYQLDATRKKEVLVEERKFDASSSATNLPPPQEFYLMLVEEKRPAHYKPLVEIRDQIERELLTQEQNRLEKEWIDRLKKKTFVRYF
jgi:peptidyl-prolyl cis-trans isomerase SurA